MSTSSWSVPAWAGLAAALTAAEAGATVLVAEAEDVVGGSSRLSGASLLGAGSKLQAQLGIEDSPERLYHYYMTLTTGRLSRRSFGNWPTGWAQPSTGYAISGSN